MGHKAMKQPKSSKTRRPYLVAMVLGTALAAMGPAQSGEISTQAISSISRYCTTCWKNARLPPDLWGDCTQEVMCRLLERVPAAAWEHLLSGESEERREFLRAIDAVKKRRQRERARSSNLTEVVSDSSALEERSSQEEREAVQQAAHEVLTARQQRILQLICEGHNVADIAGVLNLSPQRVSDEKYKAVQKLRSYFRSQPEAAA
jgi:RNA polymerase sigma factor (sigma-70 family)